MKWIVGVVVFALGVWCPAQEFVGQISYPDVTSGTMRLVDEPDGSRVWEFRIKGHAGFMRMLYEIHGATDQVYAVTWGEEEDTLRVKARTVSALTGEPLHLETMLRHVLPNVGMTYRIVNGVYNIMHRPIPVPDQVPGDGVAFSYQDTTGELSLDILSRALCEQGRGYRVENVKGSPVWLRAPFLSFEMLLWVLRELDPAIEVLVSDEVVVRARGRVD